MQANSMHSNGQVWGLGVCSSSSKRLLIDYGVLERATKGQGMSNERTIRKHLKEWQTRLAGWLMKSRYRDVELERELGGGGGGGGDERRWSVMDGSSGGQEQEQEQDKTRQRDEQVRREETREP